MKLLSDIKSVDRVMLSLDHDGKVPANTLFEYFRSGNPKGDFVKISPKTKSPYWVDTDIDLRNNEPYYYKARIIDGRKGAFTATTTINPPDVEPEFIEIARQLVHQLNYYPGQGHKYLLYTKLNSDENCPHCYDSVLQKRTTEKCEYCNGSGKLYGYIGPFMVMVGVVNSSRNNVDIEDGQIDQNLKRIWLGNFPIISKNDIIISEDKYRWKIIDVTPKQNASFLIRQDAIMAKLRKHDAEYGIPDQVGVSRIVWTNEGNVKL